MEKLEDAFMSEDVEDVPRDWVDNRQPMDLILQQGVDGVKQTEKTRLMIELGDLGETSFKLFFIKNTHTSWKKLKTNIFFLRPISPAFGSDADQFISGIFQINFC